MEIHIFILCYNESYLLPHTINHYRKYLPSCKITIYDNQSTDNSVKLALSLGCNVISWSSNNQINDNLYLKIKNNCWKNIKNGWIIMIDMDEFLCVTEDELLDEIKNETSILEIKGLGNIKYSSKIYYNKHMNTLGLNYINDKTKKRYKRSELMRNQGLATHYAYPEEIIKKNYYHALNNCKFLQEV